MTEDPNESGSRSRVRASEASHPASAANHRVRLLFALLIPLLLGGFVLALAGLEPYPAIVFPAFEQVGEPGAGIAYEKPVITAWHEGSAREIPIDVALAGIPRSFHSAVLQNRMRYANGSGLPEKRLEATLGGRRYVVRRSPRTWNDAEVDRFFRTLVGRTMTDSVTIRWNRHRRVGLQDGLDVWELEPLDEAGITHVFR